MQSICLEATVSSCQNRETPFVHITTSEQTLANSVTNLAEGYAETYANAANSCISTRCRDNRPKLLHQS